MKNLSESKSPDNEIIDEIEVNNNHSHIKKDVQIIDEFNSPNKDSILMNYNSNEEIRNEITVKHFQDSHQQNKILLEKSKNNSLNGQDENILKINKEDIDEIIKVKISIKEDESEPILKFKIFCDIDELVLLSYLNKREDEDQELKFLRINNLLDNKDVANLNNVINFYKPTSHSIKMQPPDKKQLTQEEIKEVKDGTKEFFFKSKFSDSRLDSLSIYTNLQNLSNMQNTNGFPLSETSQQSHRSNSQNPKIQLKKYKVKILQKPQQLERPVTTSDSINIPPTRGSIRNSGAHLNLYSDVALSPIVFKNTKIQNPLITINNDLIKEKLRRQLDKKKKNKIVFKDFSKDGNLKLLEKDERKTESLSKYEEDPNSKDFGVKSIVVHNLIEDYPKHKFEKGIDLLDRALGLKDESKWSEALKCINFGLNNLKEAANNEEPHKSLFGEEIEIKNPIKKFTQTEQYFTEKDVLYSQPQQMENLKDKSLPTSENKLKVDDGIDLRSQMLLELMNNNARRPPKTAAYMYRSNSRKKKLHSNSFWRKIDEDQIDLFNENNNQNQNYKRDWGNTVLFQKAKNNDFEFNSEKSLEVFNEYEIEYILTLILKREKEMRIPENIKLFYSKARATVKMLCREIDFDEFYIPLNTEFMQINVDNTKLFLYKSLELFRFRKMMIEIFKLISQRELLVNNEITFLINKDPRIIDERTKRELISKINRMREITKTIIQKIQLTRASSKFLNKIFIINGFNYINIIKTELQEVLELFQKKFNKTKNK